MALDLGKQVGPLPLGAWFVVVAGGLGIAWYTKRSGTTPTDPSTDGIPTDENAVGDGSVGGWTSTSPTGTGATSPTDATPTTNDEWFQKAERELIGRNYDPNLVDSALRKYLSGANDLSVSEYTLIGLALTLVGPLPSPLPATGQTPPGNKPPAGGGTKPPTGGTGTPHKPAPPPPKPKPKPTPKYDKYVVRKGDNLWNIAKKYYGNGARYGTIYNANKYGKKRLDDTVGMIKNPALIQPGWTLIIPK